MRKRSRGFTIPEDRKNIVFNGTGDNKTIWKFNNVNVIIPNILGFDITNKIDEYIDKIDLRLRYDMILSNKRIFPIDTYYVCINKKIQYIYQNVKINPDSVDVFIVSTIINDLKIKHFIINNQFLNNYNVAFDIDCHLIDDMSFTHTLSVILEDVGCDTLYTFKIVKYNDIDHIKIPEDIDTLYNRLYDDTSKQDLMKFLLEKI